MVVGRTRDVPDPWQAMHSAPSVTVIWSKMDSIFSCPEAVELVKSAMAKRKRSADNAQYTHAANNCYKRVAVANVLARTPRRHVPPRITTDTPRLERSECVATINNRGVPCFTKIAISRRLASRKNYGRWKVTILCSCRCVSIVESIHLLKGTWKDYTYYTTTVCMRCM